MKEWLKAGREKNGVQMIKHMYEMTRHTTTGHRERGRLMMNCVCACDINGDDDDVGAYAP